MRYCSIFLIPLILNGLQVLAKDSEEAALEAEVGNKREACGEGVGTCGQGLCCSLSGVCGNGTLFCQSPGCQIPFSNGNCDGDEKPCGPGTENIARDNSGNVPYNVVIKACRRPRHVALTFDDGPSIYTEEILDLLDKHGVKGTFFVVGNNNGKGRIDDPKTPWPKILRRMYKDGHQIGSHSYSHLDMSSADDVLRERDVRYNEMALRNVLGVIPKYFRPPYGSCTRESGCLDLLTRLGYHVVTWDLDTEDFDRTTPRAIQYCKEVFDSEMNRINKDAEEKEKIKQEENYPPFPWMKELKRPTASSKVTGSRIVLAHDGHEQTARNLTVHMLEDLKHRGVKIVTLGECLGQDDTRDWYMDARISHGASKCLYDKPALPTLAK